ncbi:MAG TPA: hypothetical protein VGK67_09260 [Myxococcales bacterium]|jgi:hypothetical protein
MRPVTPEARQLAERIVALEDVRVARGEDFPKELERLISRLGSAVAKQLGAHGFDLLVGRSIELTRARHPWLGAYEHPRGGVSMSGGAVPPGQDPAEAQAALAEVVARFVWLLESFLGEDLTRRMLSETWAGLQSEESFHGEQPE